MAFNLTAQLNIALNSASLRAASNQLNTALNSNTQVKLGIDRNSSSGFKQIKSQIDESTNAMESFGKQSGLAAKRFAAFSVTAGVFIAFTSAAKEAVSAAIDFDFQMVKLGQVSSSSSNEIKNVASEITRLATNYGVSSKELGTVAITLKQANLSLADTKIALESLAQAALAPNFENLKDTTEGAIAIMNQFKIEAKDLGVALGAVNAVAGEFAVEAGDIIEAIRKTGGAFKAAGGNLNELIALFTSVRQTTRESAESISTGLRTIFTRIQRNDTVEALRAVNIQLRYTSDEARALGDAKLENQFVGPYEAVKRLSAGLKGLQSTDPRFSAIVEQLGGYRQISKVIPLINEFATAQKALGIAQAGSTSLSINAGQAQDALIIKFQKLKETFLEVGRNIVNSPGFQSLVTTFISASSSVLGLIDSLKGLLPLITALATVKLFQGAASFTKGFLSAGSDKKDKKAEGGFLRMRTGGIVPGSGSGDKVPALLEPGEMVIPKGMVRRQMYANKGNVKANDSTAPAKLSKLSKKSTQLNVIDIEKLGDIQGGSVYYGNNKGIGKQSPSSTYEEGEEIKLFNKKHIATRKTQIKDSVIKNYPIDFDAINQNRNVNPFKNYVGLLGDKNQKAFKYNEDKSNTNKEFYDLLKPYSDVFGKLHANAPLPRSSRALFNSLGNGSVENKKKILIDDATEKINNLLGLSNTNTPASQYANTIGIITNFRAIGKTLNRASFPARKKTIEREAENTSPLKNIKATKTQEKKQGSYAPEKLEGYLLEKYISEITKKKLEGGIERFDFKDVDQSFFSDLNLSGFSPTEKYIDAKRSGKSGRSVFEKELGTEKIADQIIPLLAKGGPISRQRFMNGKEVKPESEFLKNTFQPGYPALKDALKESGSLRYLRPIQSSAGRKGAFTLPFEILASSNDKDFWAETEGNLGKRKTDQFRRFYERKTGIEIGQKKYSDERTAKNPLALPEANPKYSEALQASIQKQEESQNRRIAKSFYAYKEDYNKNNTASTEDRKKQEDYVSGIKGSFLASTGISKVFRKTEDFDPKDERKTLKHERIHAIQSDSLRSDSPLKNSLFNTAGQQSESSLTPGKQTFLSEVQANYGSESNPSDKRKAALEFAGSKYQATGYKSQYHMGIVDRMGVSKFDRSVIRAERHRKNIYREGSDNPEVIAANKALSEIIDKQPKTRKNKEKNKDWMEKLEEAQRILEEARTNARGPNWQKRLDAATEISRNKDSEQMSRQIALSAELYQKLAFGGSVNRQRFMEGEEVTHRKAFLDNSFNPGMKLKSALQNTGRIKLIKEPKEFQKFPGVNHLTPGFSSIAEVFVGDRKAEQYKRVIENQKKYDEAISNNDVELAKKYAAINEMPQNVRIMKAAKALMPTLEKSRTGAPLGDFDDKTNVATDYTTTGRRGIMRHELIHATGEASAKEGSSLGNSIFGMVGRRMGAYRKGDGQQTFNSEGLSNFAEQTKPKDKLEAFGKFSGSSDQADNVYKSEAHSTLVDSIKKGYEVPTAGVLGGRHKGIEIDVLKRMIQDAHGDNPEVLAEKMALLNPSDSSNKVNFGALFADSKKSKKYALGGPTQTEPAPTTKPNRYEEFVKGLTPEQKAQFEEKTKGARALLSEEIKGGNKDVTAVSFDFLGKKFRVPTPTAKPVVSETSTKPTAKPVVSKPTTKPQSVEEFTKGLTPEQNAEFQKKIAGARAIIATERESEKRKLENNPLKAVSFDFSGRKFRVVADDERAAREKEKNKAKTSLEITTTPASNNTSTKPVPAKSPIATKPTYDLKGVKSLDELLSKLPPKHSEELRAKISRAQDKFLETKDIKDLKFAYDFGDKRGALNIQIDKDLIKFGTIGSFPWKPKTRKEKRTEELRIATERNAKKKASNIAKDEENKRNKTYGIASDTKVFEGSDQYKELQKKLAAVRETRRMDETQSLVGSTDYNMGDISKGLSPSVYNLGYENKNLGRYKIEDALNRVKQDELVNPKQQFSLDNELQDKIFQRSQLRRSERSQAEKPIGINENYKAPQEQQQKDIIGTSPQAQRLRMQMQEKEFENPIIGIAENQKTKKEPRVKKTEAERYKLSRKQSAPAQEKTLFDEMELAKIGTYATQEERIKNDVDKAKRFRDAASESARVKFNLNPRQQRRAVANENLADNLMSLRSKGTGKPVVSQAQAVAPIPTPAPIVSKVAKTRKTKPVVSEPTTTTSTKAPVPQIPEDNYDPYARPVKKPRKPRATKNTASSAQQSNSYSVQEAEYRKLLAGINPISAPKKQTTTESVNSEISASTKEIMNRNIAEQNKPKKRREKENNSLARHVILAGGIKPSSIKKDFNFKTDIRDFGLTHVMRKEGNSLDVIASSLEAQGHFITPENRQPDDYLLELLQNKKHSLLEDPYGEEEQRRYYSQRENFEGKPKPKKRKGKPPEEVIPFAKGGLVPGTGNSDTVPMDLPENSFVIRKSSVNKIGAANLAKQARFASGGTVPALVTPGEYIYTPEEASKIGSSKLHSMNKYAKFAGGGFTNLVGADFDPNNRDDIKKLTESLKLQIRQGSPQKSDAIVDVEVQDILDQIQTDTRSFSAANTARVGTQANLDQSRAFENTTRITGEANLNQSRGLEGIARRGLGRSQQRLNTTNTNVNREQGVVNQFTQQRDASTNEANRQSGIITSSRADETTNLANAATSTAQANAERQKTAVLSRNTANRQGEVNRITATGVADTDPLLVRATLALISAREKETKSADKAAAADAAAANFTAQAGAAQTRATNATVAHAAATNQANIATVNLNNSQTRLNAVTVRQQADIANLSINTQRLARAEARTVAVLQANDAAMVAAEGATTLASQANQAAIVASKTAADKLAELQVDDNGNIVSGVKKDAEGNVTDKGKVIGSNGPISGDGSIESILLEKEDKFKKTTKRIAGRNEIESLKSEAVNQFRQAAEKQVRSRAEQEGKPISDLNVQTVVDQYTREFSEGKRRGNVNAEGEVTGDRSLGRELTASGNYKEDGQFTKMGGLKDFASRAAFGAKRTDFEAGTEGNKQFKQSQGQTVANKLIGGAAIAGFVSDRMSKSAGKPEDFITPNGGGPSEPPDPSKVEAYKSTMAFAGALTKGTTYAAAAGQALAQYGPLVAGIGAGVAGLVGAIQGYADALEEAEKAIREQKIAVGLKNLEDIYASVANGLVEVNDATIRNIQSNQEDIQKNKSQQLIADAGGNTSGFSSFLNTVSFGALGKEGYDPKKLADSTNKSRKEDDARAVTQSTMVLNKLSSTIGKDSAKELKASGKDITATSFEDQKPELLKKLRDGNSGFGKEEIRKIASTQQISIPDAEKQFLAAMKDAFESEKAKEVSLKQIETNNRTIASMALLSGAVNAAAAAADNFNARLSLNEDLFEGNIGSTKITSQADKIGMSGSNPNFSQFNSAISESSGLLGDYGQSFKAQGNAVNVASQILPEILANSTANPVSGKDPSTQIVEALRAGLKERGITGAEADKVVNSVGGKVSAEEFTKQLAEAGGDVGKATEKLLSDIKDPLVAAFKDIDAKLTEQSQTYISGLENLAKRQNQILQEFDKLAGLKSQQSSFRASEAQRSPNARYGAEESRALDVARNAQADKQMRLTGLGRGGSQDSGIIAAKLKEAEKRAEKQSVALDLTSKDKQGGSAFRDAALELTKTKNEAANLKTALKNLTDQSGLLEAAQKKLASVRSGVDDKRSFGKKLLTQTPEEQDKMLQGQAIFNQVKSQGGSLRGMSTEQNAVLFQFLENFGAAGKKIEDQILDANGYGASKDDLSEEKALVALHDRLYQEQINAQQIYIVSQQGLQNEYFTKLEDKNKTFYSNLEKFTQELTKNQKSVEKNKEQQKLAKIEDVQKNAKPLADVGITKKEDFELLNKNRLQVQELANTKMQRQALTKAGGENVVEVKRNKETGAPINSSEISSSLQNAGYKEDQINQILQQVTLQGKTVDAARSSVGLTENAKLIRKEQTQQTALGNDKLIRVSDSLARGDISSETMNRALDNIKELGVGTGELSVSADEARANIKRLETEISNLGGTQVGIQQNPQPTPPKPVGIALADGGSVFTPRGTDTVPAMLTPGEFVVNKSATQQNLPLLRSINSGETSYLSGGGQVGYYGEGSNQPIAPKPSPAQIKFEETEQGKKLNENHQENVKKARDDISTINTAAEKYEEETTNHDFQKTGSNRAGIFSTNVHTFNQQMGDLSVSRSGSPYPYDNSKTYTTDAISYIKKQSDISPVKYDKDNSYSFITKKQNDVNTYAAGLGDYDKFKDLADTMLTTGEKSAVFFNSLQGSTGIGMFASKYLNREEFNAAFPYTKIGLKGGYVEKLKKDYFEKLDAFKDENLKNEEYENAKKSYEDNNKKASELKEPTGPSFLGTLAGIAGTGINNYLKEQKLKKSKGFNQVTLVGGPLQKSTDIDRQKKAYGGEDFKKNYIENGFYKRDIGVTADEKGQKVDNLQKYVDQGNFRTEDELYQGRRGSAADMAKIFLQRQAQAQIIVGTLGSAELSPVQRFDLGQKELDKVIGGKEPSSIAKDKLTNINSNQKSLVSSYLKLNSFDNASKLKGRDLVNLTDKYKSLVSEVAYETKDASGKPVKGKKIEFTGSIDKIYAEQIKKRGQAKDIGGDEDFIKASVDGEVNLLKLLGPNIFDINMKRSILKNKDKNVLDTAAAIEQKMVGSFVKFGTGKFNKDTNLFDGLFGKVKAPLDISSALFESVIPPSLYNTDLADLPFKAEDKFLTASQILLKNAGKGVVGRKTLSKFGNFAFDYTATEADQMLVDPIQKDGALFKIMSAKNADGKWDRTATEILVENSVTQDRLSKLMKKANTNTAAAGPADAFGANAAAPVGGIVIDPNAPVIPGIPTPAKKIGPKVAQNNNQVVAKPIKKLKFGSEILKNNNPIITENFENLKKSVLAEKTKQKLSLVGDYNLQATETEPERRQAIYINDEEFVKSASLSEDFGSISGVPFYKFAGPPKAQIRFNPPDTQDGDTLRAYFKQFEDSDINEEARFYGPTKPYAYSNFYKNSSKFSTDSMNFPTNKYQETFAETSNILKLLSSSYRDGQLDPKKVKDLEGSSDFVKEKIIGKLNLSKDLAKIHSGTIDYNNQKLIGQGPTQDDIDASNASLDARIKEIDAEKERLSPFKAFESLNNNLPNIPLFGGTPEQIAEAKQEADDAYASLAQDKLDNPNFRNDQLSAYDRSNQASSAYWDLVNPPMTLPNGGRPTVQPFSYDYSDKPKPEEGPREKQERISTKTPEQISNEEIMNRPFTTGPRSGDPILDFNQNGIRIKGNEQQEKQLKITDRYNNSASYKAIKVIQDSIDQTKLEESFDAQPEEAQKKSREIYLRALYATLNSLKTEDVLADAYKENFRQEVIKRIDPSLLFKNQLQPATLYKATGGNVPSYRSNPNPSYFKARGTDTVPAMLTPGEFVVNAAATAQHGDLLNSINSGRGVSNFALGGKVSYLAEGAKVKEANAAWMKIESEGNNDPKVMSAYAAWQKTESEGTNNPKVMSAYAAWSKSNDSKELFKIYKQELSNARQPLWDKRNEEAWENYKEARKIARKPEYDERNKAAWENYKKLRDEEKSNVIPVVSEPKPELTVSPVVKPPITAPITTLPKDEIKSTDKERIAQNDARSSVLKETGPTDNIIKNWQDREKEMLAFVKKNEAARILKRENSIKYENLDIQERLLPKAGSILSRIDKKNRLEANSKDLGKMGEKTQIPKGMWGLDQNVKDQNIGDFPKPNVGTNKEDSIALEQIVQRIIPKNNNLLLGNQKTEQDQYSENIKSANQLWEWNRNYIESNRINYENRQAKKLNDTNYGPGIEGQKIQPNPFENLPQVDTYSFTPLYNSLQSKIIDYQNSEAEKQNKLNQTNYGPGIEDRKIQANPFKKTKPINTKDQKYVPYSQGVPSKDNDGMRTGSDEELINPKKDSRLFFSKADIPKSIDPKFDITKPTRVPFSDYNKPKTTNVMEERYKFLEAYNALRFFQNYEEKDSDIKSNEDKYIYSGMGDIYRSINEQNKKRQDRYSASLEKPTDDGYPETIYPPMISELNGSEEANNEEYNKYPKVFGELNKKIAEIKKGRQFVTDNIKNERQLINDNNRIKYLENLSEPEDEELKELGKLIALQKTKERPKTVEQKSWTEDREGNRISSYSLFNEKFNIQDAYNTLIRNRAIKNSPSFQNEPIMGMNEEKETQTLIGATAAILKENERLGIYVRSEIVSGPGGKAVEVKGGELRKRGYEKDDANIKAISIFNKVEKEDREGRTGSKTKGLLQGEYAKSAKIQANMWARLNNPKGVLPSSFEALPYPTEEFGTPRSGEFTQEAENKPIYYSSNPSAKNIDRSKPEGVNTRPVEVAKIAPKEEPKPINENKEKAKNLQSLAAKDFMSLNLKAEMYYQALVRKSPISKEDIAELIGKTNDDLTPFDIKMYGEKNPPTNLSSQFDTAKISQKPLSLDITDNVKKRWERVQQKANLYQKEYESLNNSLLLVFNKADMPDFAEPLFAQIDNQARQLMSFYNKDTAANNAGVSFFSGGGNVPSYRANPNPSYFKPKGTDTVPAMLSPGEFVINAGATAKHGDLLSAINSGQDVGYSATGGPVAYLKLGKTRKQFEDEAGFNLKDLKPLGPNATEEEIGQFIAASTNVSRKKAVAMENERLRDESEQLDNNLIGKRGTNKSLYASIEGMTRPGDDGRRNKALEAADAGEGGTTGVKGGPDITYTKRKEVEEKKPLKRQSTTPLAPATQTTETTTTEPPLSGDPETRKKQQADKIEKAAEAQRKKDAIAEEQIQRKKAYDAKIEARRQQAIENGRLQARLNAGGNAIPAAPALGQAGAAAGALGQQVMGGIQAGAGMLGNIMGGLNPLGQAGVGAVGAGIANPTTNLLEQLQNYFSENFIQLSSGGKSTATSDTIPAMLTPGEFVVNARSSAKNASLLHDINSGKDIEGFATGGSVGYYSGGKTSGGGSRASDRLSGAARDLSASASKLSEAASKISPSQTNVNPIVNSRDSSSFVEIKGSSFDKLTQVLNSGFRLDELSSVLKTEIRINQSDMGQLLGSMGTFGSSVGSFSTAIDKFSSSAITFNSEFVTALTNFDTYITNLKAAAALIPTQINIKGNINTNVSVGMDTTTIQFAVQQVVQDVSDAMTKMINDAIDRSENGI